MAQHLSIRVPWHDGGYKGTICQNPCYNNACLRLKGIAGSRDEEFEQINAGFSMVGKENYLPCLSEGAAFMSPHGLQKTTIHPYKNSNSATHGHFLETEVEYPPYSLPARPFRWMMKNDPGHSRLFEKLAVEYSEEREPILNFDSFWIQDAQNHRGIFKYFYGEVTPGQSLCLIYAKQVPFVEDPKRVLIGIGLVDKIIPAVEHNCTNQGSLRSMTWETMLCHTIREDRSNGFLLPYQELMDYAEQNPGFDMKKATVFVPDEYFDEFSYATERISHDAVIDILLQTIKVLHNMPDSIPGNWVTCIEWLNERLGEVWQDRGAFPGLGAMLCAVGFEYGILIGRTVKKHLLENEDLWHKLDQTINEPLAFLPPEIASYISTTNKDAWHSLSVERKTLFKLLSRFALTTIHADAIFNPEQRQKAGITLTDAQIIENPYLLYEKTRDKKNLHQIPLRKVDMAIFPSLDLQKEFPLDPPSRLSSDNDKRRIRAIAVNIMEQQTENGHTIYPCNNLTLDINDLPIEPKCFVTGDIMHSIEDFFAEELFVVPMKDGATAYKLQRMQEIDQIIKNSVEKRVNSKKRHDIQEDWRTIVDQAFSGILDELEEKARTEKTAVLKELAESRLSVLIGGAGTGKTTLLALLCSSEPIQAGGVLLLAPTGKARVKMAQVMHEKGVSANAKTVAQFLVQNRRFDFDTMRYKLSDIPAKDVPATVIIDESSMLTEEMVGALLQSLKDAQRIIFVGDPHQLPPIGAGRPFVDLVRYLNKDLSANAFPRVAKSYGELQITRRQKLDTTGTERFDTTLSKCFAGNINLPDEDIFAKLQANKCGTSVIFQTWSSNEELEELILQTLAEELEMHDIDNLDGFNKSLGGNITSNGTYFNIGCAKAAENWQILAPVRNMPYGVTSINRFIHHKYRANFLQLAQRKYQKKIHPPLGPESIVYGDKVINVINEKRNAWPQAGAANYVANGEIGIAGISFGKQIKFLNVEFSSQPGYSYSYNERDFGEEKDGQLELAYALTVHKAQGSEFKKVILILREPCNLLSRELLYTALTRQLDRLVILYNGEAYHLRNYTSPACSDIAGRFTDLFDEPAIVKVNDRYYEAGLVHRTLRGDLVRSKSEVIIANMLHDNKIDYQYERELLLDGVRKIPDFTMDDAESGDCVYWEHCGMMYNQDYHKRWEDKKAFYAKHGIIEGENLIVTYDDENGSIDCQIIQDKIDHFLGDSND